MLLQGKNDAKLPKGRVRAGKKACEANVVPGSGTVVAPSRNIMLVRVRQNAQQNVQMISLPMCLKEPSSVVGKHGM